MTKKATTADFAEISTNSFLATFSKAQANEGSKDHALLWVLDEWCEVLQEMHDYINTYSSEKRKLVLTEILDCFILADMHKVHMAEVITLLPAYNKYSMHFDIVGNKTTIAKRYEMFDSCNFTKAVMQLISVTSDDTLKNIYEFWKLKSIAKGRDAWTDYTPDKVVNIIRNKSGFILTALR